MTLVRASLLVRKVGLPLLGKRSHAFLLILGRKEALEESAFEARSFLQAEFEGCLSNTMRLVSDHSSTFFSLHLVGFSVLTSIDTFFRSLNSNLTLLGDGRSHFDRFIDDATLTDDARDESSTFGIVGAEIASGKYHLHGGGFADRFGETLRTTGTRDDAEVDLGLTKVGGG